MRRLAVRSWLAVVVVALGLGTADGFTTDAEQAIHAVIEAQIDAFRRDDGTAAFALASPAIRTLFGTPETFMEMVRRGYQPIYRARQVTYEEAVSADGRVLQRVVVVGDDGVPRRAVYVMQRQPDGRWLIDGCYLVEAEERLT